MQFLTSLTGAVSSWTQFINDYLGGEDGKWGSWLVPFLNVLSTVLWVLLILVGSAGSIYAIYVGVKMARAESAEQRE